MSAKRETMDTNAVRRLITANRGGWRNATDAQISGVWADLSPDTQALYVEADAQGITAAELLARREKEAKDKADADRNKQGDPAAVPPGDRRPEAGGNPA